MCWSLDFLGVYYAPCLVNFFRLYVSNSQKILKRYKFNHLSDDDFLQIGLVDEVVSACVWSDRI